MINVLIPMVMRSQYFSDEHFPFPVPLIEVGSKTMLERVIQNLSTVAVDVQFIFVVNAEDCKKYYIDNAINLLTDGRAHIIRVEGETAGSACSALMTIEYIDNATPLLIANFDQIFDEAIVNLLEPLTKADAGVVTFESVHPRWSYVRLEGDSEVVEASEKRPISKSAIAGLYYFKSGHDFVDAATEMIRKNESVNEQFYVAPVLNQMILKGKKVLSHAIDARQYHTFYTPQKIHDYENHLYQHAVHTHQA